MLAVALLLPIVIMVAACLLERFEAHAVAGRPAPRSRRPRAIEPPAPSLTLVPGDDKYDVAIRAAVTPEVVPGAGSVPIRRAS